MDPTVPTGWQAFSAWRALSTAQRRDAWGVAGQGSAPDDGWMAVVMAGYGATVDRLLRRFAWLLMAVYLLGAAESFGEGISFGLDPELFLGLSIASYLAVVEIVGWVRRRFQRLASSGVVGMQAAQVGAVPLAVPEVALQAEFTVPYGVPAHRPDLVDAPPAAGPRPFDVMADRRRILTTMGVYALLSGFGAWYLVYVFDSRGYSTSSLGFGLRFGAGVVLFGSCALALLNQLLHNGPKLRRGIVVSGDGNGWALPAAGFSGPWSALLAIDVRAAPTTLTRRSQSGMQVLVFRVADPEAYLARVGPVRRVLARRAMRRYGSPLIVPMFGHVTRTVLAAICAFVDVPVRWN